MPAKRVNTGDGFFFALVIALGIWFAGLMFTLIYSKGATSDFEPIAAIGGVLWATGNMCVYCGNRYVRNARFGILVSVECVFITVSSCITAGSFIVLIALPSTL